MRRTPPDESLRLMLETLVAVDAGAPGLEEKLALLHAMRQDAPDGGRQLDLLLLDRVCRLGQGLAEVSETQAKLKRILERLQATPWHPAVFLRTVTTALGPRALVVSGGVRRVVGVADDVDASALVAGEQVFLGQDQNVVIARWPDGLPQSGDLGFFERHLGGGRIVLRWRDEEVVVALGAALGEVALAAGDQLRWDRAAGIAFEKIDRPTNRRFLLDDVPVIGREQVGGQDENMELLLGVLTSALVAPAKAASYGLGGRQTVLLVGPNGVGKTLLARVAASELMRISGKRCRFGVVKPAEWEAPYVGSTQQKIRQCFKALREAARAGMAVLFLDEIEAVGRTRGSLVGHHSDKFLAALLAELDGFSERGNVAIIAATNRKDLVDAALLERLSDVEIQVRRPDRTGARAIFRIHLPDVLPLATGTTRDEIVDAAVARFYSPNADNGLCVLRLRDGRTRTVTARELGSGRLFEQVCRGARRSAFLRDVRGGAPGVTVADVEDAAAQAIERLATTLTPRNAHHYLADLPQDVDVVSVEPIVRRVTRPHRYLNAA